MAKHITIGNLTIGHAKKPVYIAEIGINHNGDLHTAMDMVDAAVDAGADIVKFQHHIPELEMVGGHQWQELMKSCAFSIEELEQLKGYVESEGAEFLCTPFCKTAAMELEIIDVKGLKTGSGECNNIPFQEHVAQYQLPTIISTGMTSRDELTNTLDTIRKINSKIVLMNCTSTYPALSSEARLKRIGWLYSTFNLPVGQSDHTPTISTALGAIAMGACCIEKHMTLNRDMPGPDQKASILPSEFKQMVSMGNEIWEGMRMCVEAEFGVLDREEEVRRIANHSVVASSNIKAGDTFTKDNLTTMRPGDGDIPAYRLEGILGCTSSRDIKKGDELFLKDILTELMMQVR